MMEGDSKTLRVGANVWVATILNRPHRGSDLQVITHLSPSLCGLCANKSKRFASCVQRHRANISALGDFQEGIRPCFQRSHAMLRPHSSASSIGAR